MTEKGREKLMNLQEFFAQHPKAALGFSGGADSAYLLYAAAKWGCRIRPYFVKTAFQPEFELRDAKRLAQELGVELTVIELPVLSFENVAKNTEKRCYYCKTALFSALKERTAQDGFSLLLDGTNASDDASDRPGMRALRELEVRSPLRECGLSKAEIRRLSKEAGLFTWDKPAYACLATRVPVGEGLTAEILEKIEGAENALYALGFSDLRVRVFHGAARVQLPKAQMLRAGEQWEEIYHALKPWFPAVFLDLNGR